MAAVPPRGYPVDSQCKAGTAGCPRPCDTVTPVDATGPTLAITSLVISILAAIAAVGQAVWTRRATTRVFRVEGRMGLGSPPGGVIHKATPLSEAEMHRHASEEYSTPVVGWPCTTPERSRWSWRRGESQPGTCPSFLSAT